MQNIDEALIKLQSAYNILHLTHHRNKNQHRLSKWYKSFGQLRRQMSKLMLELENFKRAQSISSGSENKYVSHARRNFELRIDFIRARLIPKCYLAFSNLIADNQYAVLGLMLMGTLASVKNIMQMLIPEEEKNEKEEKEITSPNNLNQYVSASRQLTNQSNDDLGEILPRREFQVHDLEYCKNEEDVEEIASSEEFPEHKISDQIEKHQNTKKEFVSSNKPCKKKRKKDDFFDNIFDELL
ncbi:putative ribonuclease mrp protein subunit rmp1 [Golovinomyces cichoracearum]|uniref:Putative ribonuclease mrp protein subunit rmp1 n=1 Tax=Golovinomyces cichoracearum TaxID=62708 RepID=A0A420HG51_9PEZI|nr:putative ribonuclease mrp protein subunit rmp1 [Golovinomyces cichoracearum]